MWLEGGSPHQNRTEATPSYHHSFIKPYCHPIAIHWIKKELCIKRWGKRCTWSQKEKQRKMENLLVHLRPHFAFALVWIVKEKSPSFFSLFFFLPFILSSKCPSTRVLYGLQINEKVLCHCCWPCSPSDSDKSEWEKNKKEREREMSYVNVFVYCICWERRVPVLTISTVALKNMVFL